VSQISTDVAGTLFQDSAPSAPMGFPTAQRHHRAVRANGFRVRDTLLNSKLAPGGPKHNGLKTVCHTAPGVERKPSERGQSRSNVETRGIDRNPPVSEID
jgi:hypothetical protein